MATLHDDATAFDLVRETEQPFRKEPPRVRYLLCSTPRCGSTLVGEYLRAAGAGDPGEFLNPRKIEGYEKVAGKTLRNDLTAYMREMKQRRTTPNGVFGMKLHFEQAFPFLRDQRDAMVNCLRRFDKVFLLRRRDKIAQAVSFYKATYTNVFWSSTPGATPEVPFNAVMITKQLHSIFNQEAGWVTSLREMDMAYETIDYEDVLADGRGQLMRILTAIGMDESAIPAELKSRFVRQGRDDDPMVREYIARLGLERAMGIEPTS